MRKLLVILLITIALSGCTTPAWTPPPDNMVPFMPVETVFPNPVLAPINDPQCVWELVVDVIDDYFKIQHEEPVRQIGSALTEGRIDITSTSGIITSCKRVNLTINVKK